MSVTVQSRQYSPCATATLSRAKASNRNRPSGDRRADSETMTVAAMRIVVTEIERRVATTLGEVAPRGLRIPGFLGEPTQPRRDLRLVGGRRPPVGLAIRLDRPVQVAVADPRRGDVPPGQIGRWRLAELGGGLPRREGRVVLIESIARLAKAEQRRRGQRRIVEPDDPAEAHRRVAKIARRQGGVGVGQQGGRLVAGQPPGP